MNKKGEFNTQGLLLGILTVGLFFGIFGSIISLLGGNYDIEGYSESDFNKYNHMQNLSSDINTVNSDVDKLTVDKGLFDYLAGIFNAVLTPFKFVYRSVKYVFTMITYVVSDLKLLDVFADYLITVFTILVIVGLVLIKFYLGKQK